MPEGHSIRRAADQWWARMGNAELELSSPQGKFDVAALTDSVLTGTRAHGKHLFLDFGTNTVHIHLGLYGRFRWSKEQSTPVGQVRMRAVSPQWTTDLSGPTTCEILDEEGVRKVQTRLGPDPLHPESNWREQEDFFKKSAWPLGKTLMEQSKIAGIGNVYRAEILFMEGLSPWLPTRAVTEQQWDRIWNLSRTLLSEGTRTGRIVTTAKNLPPAATLPPGTACATRSYVYKRSGEPCLACGQEIRSELFHSRTLYWCPTCQV